MARSRREDMNIALVVPWDQEYGGVASVVGHVGRHLRSKGHSVILVHPGHRNRLQARTTAWHFDGYQIRLRPPYNRDAPVKSIAAFYGHLLPTLIQLARLLRRRKIDLVNIHYPTDQYVYFALLRLVLGFRLVLSVHGADLFPRGVPKRRYSLTTRFLFNASDLVITPSESTLNDVVKVFPSLRIRTRFIHNAVDLEEFCIGPEAVPQKSKYILCIANHNLKKAVDVLLRAFEKLTKTDREIDLWLVGDGPLRGELERLARELGLGERVRFLGARDRESVRRYLRDCLLFVLPSRAEPFGIAILEALASRKAVVGTAVGGIPEIIQDGVTGVLVPPDDPEALCNAAQELLRNDVFRERLAEAGYRCVAQRFQWAAAGDRYESAFRALCEGRS